MTEIEKIYPKVHLETQETMNTQRNIQQKEQCWRYYCHSNKNSIVLAQKQT
jgi:hypothetical protein